MPAELVREWSQAKACGLAGRHGDCEESTTGADLLDEGADGSLLITHIQRHMLGPLDSRLQHQEWLFACMEFTGIMQAMRSTSLCASRWAQAVC